MTTNTPKSYTEIANDAICRATGAAVVACSGALATAATVCISAVSGFTVGTSAAVYNQFISPEKQVDAYQKSLDTVTYTGTTGYNTFNRACPLLFSAGYSVASTAISVTSYALNSVYEGAKAIQAKI